VPVVRGGVEVGEGACGHLTESPKDIPYGESRIVVRWNKVRWRCREGYCQRKSFMRCPKDGSLRTVPSEDMWNATTAVGRDSTTRCSLHLFDRIYLAR
jgi:hypothetical protein